MAAIGPLTTTFQAPSSCTTNTPQFYQVRTKDSDPYSYVQGPLYKFGSDCFPKGYDASPSAFYSPGVCPQGYTAACTKSSTVAVTTATGKNDDDDDGDEDAVETAFICCPTATGAVKYTCAAAPTAGGGKPPSMGCQWAFSRAHAVIGATVVKADGNMGSYGVFTESEGLFAAHSIQVRFRASDIRSPRLLNVPQTSSSTSPPSTTPTDDANAQPRTTVATFSVPVQTPGSGIANGSNNNNQPETKSEGVSTGAAIGIAIGSAVAGILVVSIIGLFFFLRWRRKRLPPPVPPKEPSIFNAANSTIMENDNNNNTLRPPYELSEEASSSNASSRPRSQSRRLRMMSSRRATRSTRRGRGDGVLAHSQASNNPAELEAVVPSNASSNMSFRSDNRSTPESTSTGGWTLRQQRDGITPTPWI